MSLEQKQNFSVLGTDVVFGPTALVSPGLVGLALTYLFGRRRPQTSMIGLTLMWPVMSLMALFVDAFHYLGHIVTSLQSKAPITKIEEAFPIPILTYARDDITPQQHQIRAIGGPIASALAVVLSVAARTFTRSGSVLRDVVNMSIIMNVVMVLGSLTPIPIFDGGSLLKWHLVKSGFSENEADMTVGHLNFSIGAFLFPLAVLLRLLKFGKLALGLSLTALAFVAIGLRHFGKDEF